MEIAEKMIEMIKSLPADKQTEVLDFIDFISKKVEEEERKQWSKFSLESAMRGLEAEESLYTINDIKEKY